MKSYLPVSTALILTACLALTASSAPLPANMSDSAMIESAGLPRFSLGASVELIDRDVTIEKTAPGNLDGVAYAGYAGIDVFSWLTVFGTAGALALDTFTGIGPKDDFGTDLRWSVGLNASLWHVDIHDPAFMRGRLAVGVVYEHAEYNASGNIGDVDWTDDAVALPVSFEILNPEPMEFGGVYSLVLYAGPIYSAIDGTYQSGGNTIDFSEDNDIGVLGGIDIYLARNVSLGCSIQSLDGLSAGASARFHF